MSACDPQHSLRPAEIQYPVRRHLLCYGTQHLRLGRLIEIDQHIATEYHVELPERPQTAEEGTLRRLAGSKVPEECRHAERVSRMPDGYRQCPVASRRCVGR